MPEVERLIGELAAAVPSQSELAAADLRAYDLALAVSLGATIDHWPAVRRTVERSTGAPGRGAALALTLTTCARATEVDDIHLRSCTTPGAVVVPVALACAAAGAPADRARAAIVTGYEAVVSLGEMLGGPAILAQGVWPTRAVAPIAAALTAAMALGLSASQTRAAAALAAGTHLTGLLPEPGRELSLGQAVFAGMTSAIAAAEGAAGPAELLEAWPRLASSGRPAVALGPGGRRRPAVLDTCVKPFCSARQALAATAFVRAMSESDPSVGSRIRSITVGIPGPHLAMVNRREIRTRLDTITSLPHQLALAIESPGSLDDVRRLVQPANATRRFLDKVTVVADPDAEASFPAHWGASVRMDLDGTERAWSVDGVPGERAASWAGLGEKARRLFGRAGLSLSQAENLRHVAVGGRLRELAGALGKAAGLG